MREDAEKGTCYAKRSKASAACDPDETLQIVCAVYNDRRNEITRRAQRLQHKRVGDLFSLPLALAFLLCFSLPYAGGQTTSSDSLDLAQLSRQAAEAQRRGDYRGAAAIYEQVLQHQPDWPEVRSNLGLMYHFLGEYQKAASDFESALHANPRLYVANLFLGLDLLTLHAPQKGLPFLQRACDLNQHDPQVQVGLGATYLALGNREKARYAYERAAFLDPKSADAWYGLGVSYLDLQKATVDRLADVGRESPYARDLAAHSLLAKGTPDAALNMYRGLLASKVTLPCLEADLGFAYIQTQDFKSAEEAFGDELRDHSGCLLARLGKARVNLEKRMGDEALDELFRVWTCDRNFLKENLPALFVGLDEGKVTFLRDTCVHVSDLRPESSLARFLISAMQALQNETYEPRDPQALISGEPTVMTSTVAGAPAVQGAERFLEQGHYTACDHSLWPRRSRLTPADLRVLCACAYNSGDLRTSFLAGGDLARNSSDIVPGLYWKAKSAERLGQAALRQAGLLAPNSPRIHFVLGEFYRQAYQEDQAEEEYLKVIELQPSDVAAHLGLADAYSLSTDFDKATVELKRVLALDPGQADANYLMGKILVTQHHYDEAMPYLESVLTTNTPRAPEVHALISKVYAAQGRTADAISELRQGLMSDRDGSLHYELSMLYRKAGDAEAADAALAQSKLIFQQRQGHAGKDTNPADSRPKPDSP